MSGGARIAVAMSGGVDSSVAAALLKEQGHTLLGVTLKLAPEGSQGQCCGLDGVARARRVCARLDIPFTVLDATGVFRHTVVDPFVADYAAGRTPNPCVSCNRHVKFDWLFQAAKKLGFDHLATGHYAAIGPGPALVRAADSHKDQSYALYMLTHEQLGRVHFPLGGLTKPQVREIAGRLDLATAHTPESQDICFVGASHVAFLERERPGLGHPGDMVTRAGEVVGQHHGLHRYTTGQRQGLGVGGGHGHTGAWYVLGLDTARNRLLVGSREELGQTELRVDGVSTTLPGNDPAALPRQCRVQVRYGQHSVGATLSPGEAPGGVRVATTQPVVAAPGQAAVFYDEANHRVLGGGTILSDDYHYRVMKIPALKNP